jgi:hypothetical protein
MEISPRFAEQVAEPDLAAGWLAVLQITGAVFDESFPVH